ncbi:MAG: thiaminase II [Chloroflexi bacterium]|nr:thiaminase II [Chloroflexota bacterium]
MRRPFTQHLRALAEPIWEAEHQHPFIQGLRRGDLEVERFKHWVRQDYLFLIEYGKLLALAAVRSPDLDAATRLTELAGSTFKGEMELHRSYARALGITEEELAREAKAPTCQAYADFLLRTAALGSYAELVAALLPCMWGFSEIGRRLLAQGLPTDERYARWIGMYGAPEFEEQANWCRGLVDRVAEGASKEELQSMEQAFLTSSRYELLFWEMAWKRERWPA